MPIGIHVIALVLASFRGLHPRAEVDLRLTDRIVDLVEEGMDVAVRICDLPDLQLLSRRLGPYRLCCFASPEYLASRGTPEHPDQLTGHDTVAHRYQSSG